MSAQEDWQSIAKSVAIDVLGEPSKRNAIEWRWGNKGSFVLNVEDGTFFDFENNDGGGLLWFLKLKGLNPDDYIKTIPKFSQPSPSPKKYKSYTNSQMSKLRQEAVCYVRYSDNFCVMRFKEDHSIKQKYAPFSRIDNKWILKRPEGKLPIYLTGKNTNYVIITEGEKAMLAAEKIFDHDVCCHHGGVGNYKNCDWSLLKDRNILIWPDNDTAGKKFAEELSDHINNICKTVNIIKPHKELEDKEDLHEVLEKKIFNDSNAALDYCLTNIVKKKVSFELVPVSQIINNIQKPNWLVKDVCEFDSVIAIFGAPKAGKSFVTVDLAAHISKGLAWNGYDTKQSAVVYLAGEGQRGIARRLGAWSHIHNQKLNDAPLLISNRGARLLDDQDHEMLKETIYKAEETYGGIGMIIVDTLARNFGAGNENSTEDMNAFVERIDDLKNTFSSCICLVHHTGHGTSNRARGSSVLPAAVDWEYKVSREDINGEMFVKLDQTLVKDGNNIESLDFKFDVVSLPFDDSTSGALVQIKEEDRPRRKDLNDNDNKVYNFILEQQSNSDSPASLQVRHNEILTGTGLSKNIVNKSLKKLTEYDKVVKKDQGYQTNEYISEIF